MNALSQAEAEQIADCYTDPDRSVCFHCGQPVQPNAAWQVQIDDAPRAMCCPGCAAVAQAIVDHGLSDYYRTRISTSATAELDRLNPPQLKLYDSDEMAAKFGTDADQGEGNFSVEGLRCAACVWLIERTLARLPGVTAVEMNVATARVSVSWRRSICKPSNIIRALYEIGYVAYPYDAEKHGEQLEAARKKLFRRVFIAGLSMMQVMMYAIPVYLATDGTMDHDMSNLMRYAGLLLTLPAVFYSALPFFQGAWISLKNRLPGMDLPVSIGIAAAFVASAAATFRGRGDVYFDSVTMFIFLLLCSRYLELLARRKAASALEDLQRALPASALRLRAYPKNCDTTLIGATQLRIGDAILIKPGEAIPADSVILEGETSIDLSLLTGESRLQTRIPGDPLQGGAVNATQTIVARVSRPVGDSTLPLLMKLIERAGRGKPRLALWADHVAAWFVGTLLLFTVAVFIIWQYIDPTRAWPIAIAVLVVSCPCALSLATPTALAAASNRLLRRGVLVVHSHVLETLQRTTHVVFDKTGTLTIGKPTLRHIETMQASPSEWCLQTAATLAAASTHPLSIGLTNAAKLLAAPPVPIIQSTELRHVAGQGIEGVIDGVRYRLGSAAFIEALNGITRPDATTGNMTVVYFGTEEAWLARFDLADAVRDDAAAVVRYFKQAGKQVVLLSGDNEAATLRMALELDIATAIGQQLPEHKLSYVKQLQQHGAVVAMIGDGINDAAVLRAADVSFAMGEGSALAQVHADCVLLSGRLSSLSELADTATQTVAIMRQNLVWALIYNVIAIPAAAFGLLNPWMSGIGMSLSSALVVANALRLQRKPGASTIKAANDVAPNSQVN